MSPFPQQLVPRVSKIFIKHISFLVVTHNICLKGKYSKTDKFKNKLKTLGKYFHYLLELQSFIFLQIA